MQRNGTPYFKPWTAGTSPNTLLAERFTFHNQPPTDRQDFQQKTQSDETHSTAQHLAQYLRQLIMDNCHLKSQLEGKEKEVRCLQQELTRKERQSKEIYNSKRQIDETVKRVSNYNAAYIDELERKNKEIDELKRRLLEAPYKQISALDSDDSSLDDPKSRTRPRYKALREDIMGKKESNNSTVSGGSLLENAKRSIQKMNMGAVRRRNPTGSTLSNGDPPLQ